MEIDNANDEVCESLAAKLNGLDLTGPEGEALATIMKRAGAASDDDVEGYGWDEGVAAVKAGGPSQIMSHPYFGSLGIKVALGRA